MPECHSLVLIGQVSRLGQRLGEALPAGTVAPTLDLHGYCITPDGSMIMLLREV